MKKFSVRIPCALAALALVFSASGFARQTGGGKGVRAGASLEASLDQLEQALKRGAAIDFRMRYPRTTYTRLKRAGGCDISLRESQVPGGAHARDVGNPVTDLSSAEWRVNLSGLDPAGVRVEKPSKGDYRIIHFAAAAGREAIRREGYWPGDAGRIAEGRIYVGEGAASAVATALEKAISACRE
ncbi:MAG TPA: hypothetical protein VK422_14920 [Pyrinomonadaceae bacterium]|nr:hypothetical protein [Pyrinomonadaceae bacterium]